MTPPDASRGQFEQRMRLRRAATCVSAARISIESGRVLEAEDRLEEACRLDPENLEARVLLEQLRSAEPEPPSQPILLLGEAATPDARRWSHWVAVLIAVVALGALAWWRTPGPDETRINPARQPEQRGGPRPEAPARARMAPAETPTFPEMPPSAPAELPNSRSEVGTAGPLAPPATATRPPRTVAIPSFPAPLAAQSAAGGIPAPPAEPVPRAVPEPVDLTPAPGTTAAAVPGLLDERPSHQTAARDAATAPPPALTAPSPAADAAPASLRDGASGEEAAIGQALEQYVDAYNRLDARAASRVWPTVDERALARAFAGLESQGIAFEGCELAVQGSEATAACRGRARYVPKVGDRDPISQSRRWAFRLHRAAGGWQIVQAEAR
jgi:hypothetical protein